MYFVQGSIVALVESTLPQILNRKVVSLVTSETLAAPFVDHLSHRTSWGYKGFVIMLQIPACASLIHIAPMREIVTDCNADSVFYLIAMPIVYFHVLAVLASRCEQFGFSGEDCVFCDHPLALITVVLLFFATQRATNVAQPLAFFLRMYLFQAVLVTAMLLQYLSWTGATTPCFTLTYVLL